MRVTFFYVKKKKVSVNGSNNATDHARTPQETDKTGVFNIYRYIYTYIYMYIYIFNTPKRLFVFPSKIETKKETKRCPVFILQIFFFINRRVCVWFQVHCSGWQSIH